MRRVAVLAVAALVVSLSGCSGGGSGGATGSPSASPTLAAGPWTTALNTVAVKAAKQIIKFRDAGQPVPKDMSGFKLFLSKGQHFGSYSSHRKQFSFCVLSSQGWVAFDSTYGGTVAFGTRPPCSKKPLAEVLAVHKAAADLAVTVAAAVAKQTGDPLANVRKVFDHAALPAGITLGATDVGYRTAAFCVEDDNNMWASYSLKAPTADHLVVGVVGGC